MDALLRDLRFAFRRLRKRPGFTAIAVVSLAVGIGANTAIFALIDAVILRDPPIERPEEVVEVYFEQADFPHAPLSYPDYRDLRDRTTDVFSGVLASQLTLAPRQGGDGGATMLPIEMVSGNYFELLGLDARVGRLLVPEDDVAKDGHPVVVLSHAYWAREYASDPGAVGSTLRLTGRDYTIVGVAPESWEGMLRGLAPDLFVPIQMMNALTPDTEDLLEMRGNHSVFVKGRLAPGVGLERASAAAAAVAEELRRSHPDYWPGSVGIRLVPTTEVVLNPSIDRVIVPAAALLMAVVGMVLLIACANLASFLLAQANDRRKEVAIRLAIGSGRAGLVRQLLTESLALAAVAGAAGIAVGYAFMKLLLAVPLPVSFPVRLDLRLDPTVLGFAIGISILAGLLFGLAPALQSTRPNIAGTLRDEGTGGGRPRRLSLRNMLVVGQVAVSLLLLVTAGLFLRSLDARQGVDPGFGREPAAILTLALPATRYDEESGRIFMRRMLDRLAALDDVRAVGTTTNLHLNPLNNTSVRFNVDGHTPPEGEDAFVVDSAPVDSGFFAATGIPLLAGRNFGAADVPDGPRAVIINRTLADRFWPGQEAVGRVLRRQSGDYHVVGVAGAAKIRSLGEAPRGYIYRAASQEYSSYVQVIARTAGDPDRTLRDALASLRDLDRDVVVIDATTMERHLALILLPTRLAALAFTALAAVALVLALIGLYGVVSYAVTRRTREVGIRMSLGADRGSVVRLLMANGLTLVAIGAGVGIALALAGGQAMRALLFGISPADPVTLLVVPVLLAAVAALAAWWPARRASRIDPVRALRAD